jgi:molecular chaperone DnaK (HSP70)
MSNPSFSNIGDDGNGACIGIDLGTSYCSVGIWRGDHVEILENEEGDFQTPSYISFYDNEFGVVGEPAKFLAPSNAGNAVYDVKRIIGHRYNEKYMSRMQKHWTFKLSDGPWNIPTFEAKFHNVMNMFTPQDLSGILMRKLKGLVDKELKAELQDREGSCIRNVVVTVPAHFNEAQRQATKEAVKYCGLHVNRLLSEPSATALAHMYYKIKKLRASRTCSHFFKPRHFTSILTKYRFH